MPGWFNAPHAARCVARHGVRSDAVPVALMGECSMRRVERRAPAAVAVLSQLQVEPLAMHPDGDGAHTGL